MTYREVEKCLKKNGWFSARQNGSHVQFFNSDGKGCTVDNHPGEDISIHVVKDIERKTGLTLR